MPLRKLTRLHQNHLYALALIALIAVFPKHAHAGLSCTRDLWRTVGRVGPNPEEIYYFWVDAGCTGTPDLDRREFSNEREGGGQGGTGSGFRGNRGTGQAGIKETTCGNPVVASTGNKIEPEADFGSAGEAALYLSREYNKYWDGVGLFGKQWISNFDFKLTFGSSEVNACYPRPGGSTCSIGSNTIIYAHRPDARTIKFIKNAVDGIFYEDKTNPVAKIAQQPNGEFVLYGEDSDVERYSSAGYISEVKSETGVGWTFGYSGTYPIRVTHTSGRYVDFVWTNGQLTSVRDPAGNYYGYAYLADYFGTGLHLLSATAKPGSPGTAIAYHYEDSRFPGALTGKSYGGVRYSYFSYGVTGVVTSSEHGGGKDRYSFTYIGTGDPNDKSTDVTNPLGLTTEFSYINGREQTSNRFGAQYCPSAARYKTVDANGNDDLVQDFNNNITDYDYNDKGQLVKKVEASGKPYARTTDYAWETNKNRVSSITVVGMQRTEFTYTADNRLASVSEVNLSSHGVANQTRTITYAYSKHPNGMLATVTVDGPAPGNGDAIVKSYNTYGDLISITNSLGQATTYANHDGLGQPGRVTGPNGDITDYIYDAQGRVTTVRRWISGVAADTTYTYNAQGLLEKTTTPDGVESNYEYDSARRLTRTWRAANGTVSGGASKEDQLYTYDLMGNVTRIDSRKLVGHYETQCKKWMTIEGVPECVQEENVWVEVPTITQTSLIDYDELGRVRSRRGNNGQNVRYTYDNNGNVKTITDASNRVTTFAYDALDRVVSSTDPSNGVTGFAYDAGDRVTSVTDPANLTTAYVYDGFGQLWAQSSPDTSTSAYQYNSSGQLTLLTRSDSSTLSYQYDTLGRLTWYGTSTEGRGFVYDACTNGAGRLCRADYGNGTKLLTYTPQGQLQSTYDWAPTAGGDTTAYSYDTMGRLTGISYPSGISAGYGYSNGKLTTMTATINGATQVIAGSINYQPYGGISNWTYGNNVGRAYAYDLDGRVTGITASRAANDLVQSLSYGYNANDEITGITNGVDANLTQAYGYDALSRLTSQSLTGNTMTLAYDGVGNRTQRTDNAISSAYTYQPGNHRLSSVVNGSLSRTFNVNVTGVTTNWTGPDGVANAMAYDAYLRPKTHTRNGVATSYWYNALDQRVSKSNPTTTARYIYAGQNTMLAENNNGQWTNHLYLGGQPVGLVKGGTLYWISSDHLGRPEVATNTAKQVVWRANNWAFNRGIALDQIGGYNLGFPGQYWDSESGLWQNGFRDYEPTIGRYLRSDPIGLSGGTSTYIYAEGNPVSLSDPFGLRAKCKCTDSGVVININFVFAGDGATPEKVLEMTSSIESRWSAPGFSVTTSIGGWRATKIDVPAADGRSFMQGNHGTWYAEADPSVAAHEAGHIMGLHDRYTDSASGYSVPQPGWEGTIMAEHKGVVTPADRQDVLSALGCNCACGGG